MDDILRRRLDAAGAGLSAAQLYANDTERFGGHQYLSDVAGEFP